MISMPKLYNIVIYMLKNNLEINIIKHGQHKLIYKIEQIIIIFIIIAIKIIFTCKDNYRSL